MISEEVRIHHPGPYIERQIKPAIERNNLSAEVVWTYLLATIYENDLPTLVEQLCGKKEKLPENAGIWLETYLYPTRERRYEGKYWKTRADLVIGHVKLARDRTRQIVSNGDWVCVAESKWFDDIHANPKFTETFQLAQVIEHALLLHGEEGNFPERVYVTMITPAYFMQTHNHFTNRKYHRKYHEYKSNRNALIKDLQICTFPFIRHDQKTLIERVDCLILNWVSFDDLLGLPDLVTTQIPDKYRNNRKTWEQIFTELGRLDTLKVIGLKF